MEQFTGRLYKHREICEHTAQIFTASTLRFSTPEVLDDPFECAPCFVTNVTKEEFTSCLEDELRERDPDAWNDDIRKEARKVVETDWPLKEEKRIEHINKYRERLNKIGIFSASRSWDSVLMWSHYAKGHTGICLELDLERLPGNVSFHPVRYSATRPIINLFKDRKTANIVSVTTKGLDWSYQQEWRIVLEDNGTSPFPQNVVMPNGFISAVILGAKISPPDLKKVLKWVKQLKVTPRLYETMPDDQQFRMTKRRIKSEA